MLKTASILLLAGLGVAGGARAAEREFGGEVSVGVGFKPEFVEAEGDGKYALVTGKVRMTTDKTWSLSLSESLNTVEHPEKKSELMDPVVALGYLPNLLDGTGLKLKLSVSLRLGLSLASRDENFYGAATPTVAVSKKLGAVEVATQVSHARHVRKYTRTDGGRSSVSSVTAGLLSASCDLGAGFSALLGLSRYDVAPFEGPHVYGFENTFSLGYDATDALSFEVGISNSDAQRRVDGSYNDEFTLYRQNKTEMYVGATYAL